MNSVFQHWRTTLFGFLAAVINLWATGIGLKQALVSASLMALGAVSSDANKVVTK